MLCHRSNSGSPSLKSNWVCAAHSVSFYEALPSVLEPNILWPRRPLTSFEPTSQQTLESDIMKHTILTGPMSSTVPHPLEKYTFHDKRWTPVWGRARRKKSQGTIWYAVPPLPPAPCHLVFAAATPRHATNPKRPMDATTPTAAMKPITCRHQNFRQLVRPEPDEDASLSWRQLRMTGRISMCIGWKKSLVMRPTTHYDSNREVQASLSLTGSSLLPLSADAVATFSVSSKTTFWAISSCGCRNKTNRHTEWAE